MKRQANMLATAAAIALLTACSSGDDEGTSGEGADGSASAAATLEPGQYEVTIKVLDMAMPEIQGMPDNAEEMFRSTMESTATYCLTPEDVADSAFSRTREQAEEQMGGDCTVERDNNSNDTLDMEVVCKPEGGEARMTLTGEMTDDGIRAVTTVDGDVAGQRMSFTTEHVSRRIGECEEPATAGA